MRKTKFLILAVLIGLVSCEKNESEDVKYYTLDANGKLAKAESYFLGTDESNPAGNYFAQDIVLDPFVVSHSFATWGFGEGFTYTNCSNDTTANYTNLSGITAKGVKGDTYFIANAREYSDTPSQISFKDGKAYKAIECYVTNSTYAYRSMQNGDDYAKKFEQGDWFKLTITGFSGKDTTDQVDMLLANGTDIAKDWVHVDLQKLGKVTSIKFTLSSSDNGQWGMNTPSYFCLDQLKISE